MTEVPEGSDQREDDPRGEGIEGGAGSTEGVTETEDKISGKDAPEAAQSEESE